ncbi:MAG: response regulator [Alphaproteobacteria bacterium]|nr:response regulator [Alphaproteobacteria bacterium]
MIKNTGINYGKMTAIVIDDQEFVRTIVSKILKDFGFGNVLTAIDGGTGLSAIETNKPDIIICDIRMKPVGGLEFLKKLRAHPLVSFANIPVIIMTANLSADVMIKAKELGMNAAVVKPVPPKRLREKIDAIFIEKPPEKSQDVPKDIVQAEPKTGLPKEYAKLKVLVIDDQMFARRIILEILHGIGFRLIEEATDGAAALQTYNTFQPDLILCDIEMKPMGGLSFLQILRNEKPQANRVVPVIFLSSQTDLETVARAERLGVDAFVAKPVSMKALLERINHVLFRES